MMGDLIGGECMFGVHYIRLVCMIAFGKAWVNIHLSLGQSDWHLLDSFLIVTFVSSIIIW